jgi:hypothetical protein
MPSKKITFADVRKIGLELPDVAESTAYGSPALKVRGKLLTCLPVHKSAEPESLAVCIDFNQRAELVAADPDTYYLTDHYVNYPAVLVRLPRINLDALRDLIGMGWRFANSRASKGKRPVRRRKASASARG